MWLALLVVIGGGVLAARTLGRSFAADDAVATRAPTTVVFTPTTVPVAAPVAAATAALRPTATPVVAAAARAVRTPTATAVAAASTSKPTPRPPTSTPVAATTSTPVAASTSTPHAASTTAAQPATTATPKPTAISASAASHGAIALTFDAGADRGYAQDILDLLADQHVVASFGITGVWARANPDLVRRMAVDGHLVFNHTLDHRSFTGVSDSLGGLSAAARRAELDDADAIIAPLIGHSTRPFYRLPYGDDDAHVASDVAPDGYSRKIGWTVDSLGWKGVQSTDILARCLKLAAPGAVYVMHVGRASQDAIALPQVIGGLRERGFGFARVDAI